MKERSYTSGEIKNPMRGVPHLFILPIQLFNYTNCLTGITPIINSILNVGWHYFSPPRAIEQSLRYLDIVTIAPTISSIICMHTMTAETQLNNIYQHGLMFLRIIHSIKTNHVDAIDMYAVLGNVQNTFMCIYNINNNHHRVENCIILIGCYGYLIFYIINKQHKSQPNDARLTPYDISHICVAIMMASLACAPYLVN